MMRWMPSLAWILMMVAATVCHGADEILVFTPQNPSTRSRAKITPDGTSGTLTVGTLVATTMTLQGQPPLRIIQTDEGSNLVAVDAPTTGTVLGWDGIQYLWVISGPTTTTLDATYLRLDTTNDPLTDDLEIQKAGGATLQISDPTTASVTVLSQDGSGNSFLSGTQDLTLGAGVGNDIIATAHFIPILDSNFNLGNITHRWSNTFTGTLTGTSHYVAPTAGNTLFEYANGAGEALSFSDQFDGGIITFDNGNITASNVKPEADATSSLGDITHRYNNAFIKTLTGTSNYIAPATGNTLFEYSNNVGETLSFSDQFDGGIITFNNGSITADSLTPNTILQANGSDTIVSVANGSTSQVLTIAAGPTFVWRTPGGGSGIGTVYSVGLALPTAIFDISGSPVTTAGTLTATFDTQSANVVFAGPATGAAAAPTMRALVTADFPTNGITDAKFRQGVARSVVGVTGNSTANVADIQGTADQVLRVNTAGTALAFGTVANAGLTNSSITIAGTSVALGGSITETTMLDSIGSTRGMLPLRGASVWAGLAIGAANRSLLSDGTDAAWGQVSLTAGVTGILPVANGGTAAGAFTAGSVVFAGASGVYTQDNASFFFDDTNNRLGLLTAAPGTTLDVRGIATIRRDALGTSATDGAILSNTTAAAAGAQQVSPATHYSGRGWKTDATAASQSVDWYTYLIPVQGAAAPSCYLSMATLINGGGFTERYVFTSGNQFLLTQSGARVAVGKGTANSALDVLGDSLLDGALTVNDSGAAVNTRIESDTNANMLLVDGINNKVGIGTATPAQTLDVFNAGTQLQLSYDASNYARFAASSGGVLSITSSAGTGIVLESTAYPGTITSTRILLGTAANVVGTSSIFTFDPATSIFTVGGRATSTFNISSVAAAIAAGTGAGTGPTLSITGNAHAGKITLLTGTLPTGGGATIATITPGITAPTGFYPVITSGNIATALLSTTTNNPYATGAGTTTWTLNAGTTGLVAATTYIWDYYAGVN